MKTSTRKTRPQPSLAPLTTEEYHQLADMVRTTRAYEDIRQQIAKPRSEGGFDLHISIKPLQVLRDRVSELDRINQQIGSGQKLTLTGFDELQASDTPPAEEIHNAILRAAHHRVLEHNNTPHQLLALQRLADFPARAGIRANREQRAEEMHAHRIEMNHFNQHIVTKRLHLVERSLTLRVAADVRRLTSSSRDETEMITTAAPADPITENNQEKENSSSPSAGSAPSNPKPNPFLSLPPETIAKNLQHLHDLAQGKIKPKFIPPEIPCPDPDPLWDWLMEDYVAPPHVNDDANHSAEGVAQPHSAPEPSHARKAHVPPCPTLNSRDDRSTLNDLSTDQTTSSPSANSALTPVDLATRVKRYNFLRAQEYAAYREKYSDLPASEFPPQYNTEHHHCPCGNPTTCPDHENETLGAFPGYFWKLPPGNPHYLACLRDHNLPYRDVL